MSVRTATAAFLAAVCVLASGNGSLTARQSATGDPLALATAIQQHYDRVRDFSADFVHTYAGGILRKTVTERGTVRIKKPGLMRWVYTSPERKEFVSDGTRFYAYVPEDRQVTVGPAPSGDGGGTPAVFLAGRGHLTRDFTAATPSDREGMPAGTAAVQLTPRRTEPEFDWMRLVVDQRTFVLRALITMDAQGGRSTFTFERTRENSGLNDQDFRFTIPRGVDVISNDQAAR